MAITETGLVAIPPHISPDAGLVSIAAGLVFVPNAVDYQRKRQRTKFKDQSEFDKAVERAVDRELIRQELEKRGKP